MAEHETQQEHVSSQAAQDAANTIRSLANVAKAAGKAATGNVAGAAKDILTDGNAWKVLLCILLSGAILFVSVFAMLGVTIIGVADTIVRTWTENWDESWEEQGISSNGSSLYLYTSGSVSALADTALKTIGDFFAGLADAFYLAFNGERTNADLPGDDLTGVESSDYENTLKALYDQEALIGQNGALRKRLDMIKGRVLQRGQQIQEYATSQYSLQAIGLGIAATLYEEYNNPVLYKGVSQAEFHFDLSAFELSDIQALKILAAYSIQHEGNVADTEMWDLMDYCGWYAADLAQMDESLLGRESIYESTTASSFTREIGGVVDAGQDGKDVYILAQPYVPVWTGTFAPQWYYEEIQQIKELNEHYRTLESYNKPELLEGKQLYGVIDGSNDIDISAFERLSAQPTIGIIDKLFSSSYATLTISREEYESADGLFSELRNGIWNTISEFASADGSLIKEQWQEAYGAVKKRTKAGNLIQRDEENKHSYTVNSASTSYSYFLRNNKNKTNTARTKPDKNGKPILFIGLAANTSYTLYRVETVKVNADPAPTPEPPQNDTDDPHISHYDDSIREDTKDRPAGSSQSSKPQTEEVITEIETFKTFKNTQSREAYSLILSLDIHFAAKSIDELLTEMMGLWPGNLNDTIKGLNGKLYPADHVNNALMEKNWTDTYTAPDGTTHTLQFERQNGYQQEAYQDMILGLAALLNIDAAGLYEPEYGYGDDIIAMAEKEIAYYAANNLTGGARYWNICAEGSGRRYGTDQPWCVCFVNAIAYLCGYFGEDGAWGNWESTGRWIFDCGNHYKYMISEEGGAIGHNSVAEGYKPVPGDLWYVGRDVKDWRYAHVGIVKEVTDQGNLVMLEGNTWLSGSNRRVAREVHYKSSYQIGSFLYISDGDAFYTCAYAHPNYPSSFNAYPYYLSIPGLTSPTTGSKTLTGAQGPVYLFGPCRFRANQMTEVLDTMKNSYKEVYNETLHQLLIDGNVSEFAFKWNSYSIGSEAEEIRQTQQSICAKLYVRPVANAVYQNTGFDWTDTEIREEILWGLVTTSNQQNKLISILSYISDGLSNTTSDAELIAHLQENSFLTATLNANQTSLWPGDSQQMHTSWIQGIDRLLNILANKTTATN